MPAGASGLSGAPDSEMQQLLLIQEARAQPIEGLAGDGQGLTRRWRGAPTASIATIKVPWRS